jgi:hypothetical protein
MIEQASLVLGNGNWAVKSDSLLGYKTIDGKYYPREFTFTRATTGTRVNEAGLVEVVPYNLLTYSEDLTPNYTYNYCSITSNQIDPNGTNNAKRITNGGTAPDAYFEQSIGITDNIYTWSIFVKQGTATTATIRPVHVGIGGDVSLLTFTFATQIITTTGAITTSGFTTLNNGWYRIFCSVPITNAVSSLRGRFANPNTPNVYNDWFGAQLVQGTEPLDYLPTTDRLDIARIDYSTGEPALLLEPQRTNVWLNSDDFNAGTISSSLITYTANTTETTAPNGTNTADKFEVTTSGGDARRRFTRTIAIQNFSLSLYVKGAAGQKLQLFLARDSFAELKDITTTLNGEWQRIVLNDSFSTTSSTVVMGVEFGFTSDDSVAGQIYYLWGAQLEAGSYATSYIPTTTASVTRNADVCLKTGISSLIGQTEGTIFFDANFDDSDTVNFSISDGTSSNYVLIDTTSARSVFARVQQGGVTQAQISTTSSFYSVGERLKCAIAYKSNDFAFYINGTSIGTDNSGSVPTLDQLRFSRWNGALAATQRINQTILFPTRLTNDQLEQLTTI